jgi:hypothetical protein
MFYRVHQFVQAFFPDIRITEIAELTEILSPQAKTLFLKQSRAEQRHALDVTKDLMSYEDTLLPNDFHDLITAALLHDCGKTLLPIRLWQRVYIVMMQQMPQSLWDRLEKGPKFLAGPLKTASYHALWGSNLAQNSGLNSRVCLLIREHHAPSNKLSHLLFKADNEH